MSDTATHETGFPSPTGLYKMLDEDRRSCHGGSGRWTIGRRRSVRGALVACKRGIHVCTIEQLAIWLGPRIHPVIEASDERVEEQDKVVLRYAAVGPALETWNEATARLYAADCAEHVLPLFEPRFPSDDRPQQAIAAARAFARGEIGEAELAAAREAAWAAGWDAAGAAAWAAARAAAWATAEAAGAARAAAGAAAGAAGAAARAAGAARAARAAARQWQTDRLRSYLAGEVDPRTGGGEAAVSEMPVSYRAPEDCDGPISDRDIAASWAALDDEAAVEQLCSRFEPGPARECRQAIYRALAIAQECSEYRRRIRAIYAGAVPDS